MVIPVLSRKLLRELWSRKGPLLALAVIAWVGIGSFIGMQSVYYDLEGSRDRFYRDYRLADFTVNLKRAPVSVLEQVADLPNVRLVEGRVSAPIRVHLPGVDEPLSGLAVSLPERRTPRLNDVLLTSGAWFEPSERKQTLLNHAFARENALRPGDRLQVVLLGEEHELLVMGRARSPEFVYVLPPGGGFVPDPKRTPVLYLPERFLQEAFEMEGACNQLVGLVYDRDPQVLRNTLQRIEERLEPYGVTFSVPREEQASVQFLENELQELETSATVMPALFLSVVAMVLNLVVGRLVAQQRTVIGTLRALGYTPGFLRRHYLGYGLAVGAAGAAGGLALGAWAQSSMLSLYRQFYELPDIRAGFYPPIVGAAIGMTLLFSLVGSIGGVRAASRLEPAEAMRPPPPEVGRAIVLERFGWLWRRLPFTWKMVLRAIFRNPFRSSASIFASLISTALIVESLGMLSSFNFMMDHQFRRTSHQDITVNLQEPVGREVVAEFRRLPDVGVIEPQFNVASDLSHGQYRKRVGVVGLEPGRVLYTPLDRQGRPVEIPEQGIVLDQKLSTLLHVQPGDTVILRPLIGRRESVRAPVVGTVDGYVGLGAYARIEYLSGLVGEEWVANSLLADLHAGATAELLEELHQRPLVLGIDYRARALAQLKELLDRSIGVSLGILILFSGSLAFGSVLNTALVSLAERQREVGTLRVLGYTPAQVSGIFGLESLLLNGLGVAVGLFAGIGLVHLIASAYDTELFRFPVLIEMSALGSAVAAMAVFIGLAQAVVAQMVRRLPWLEVFKVRE
ncbi:MAG: FtsX-like permease family protein [Armatimonadetes bacterium]|nr:FtsX-like permease family protein [Armatimonadota bacterium]